MLNLEQAGERLHSLLNFIERRLKNIKNKEQRYWCLLKQYENLLKANMCSFEIEKRVPYKPRDIKQKAKKVRFAWKK